MHLMATYLPFLMHCAFRTSENVPSPFFATRRYSVAAARTIAGVRKTTSQELGRSRDFFTKTRSKRQTGASRFRSRGADKTGGGRPSRQARHGPLVASRAGGRRGRTHTDRDPDPAARASGPMDIDASPKPGPASGHPTTQKRHDVADEKRRVAQMPIGDRRLSDASRGWSSAFSSVRSIRRGRVTCSRNRTPRAPRAMTTRSRLAVLRRRPRATGI